MECFVNEIESEEWRYSSAAFCTSIFYRLPVIVIVIVVLEIVSAYLSRDDIPPTINTTI